VKKLHIYLLVGIGALITKLFIEFQTSFIPGINGGYYPVQIREILNSGKMAVPDMPFVFYFNAMWVKVFSFFVSETGMPNFVINVVKIIGSVTIPVLLIPVYFITQKLTDKSISGLYEYSLVAFIVLSFSPIELGSEAMKNALGLSFMTFFMYYFLQYINTRNRKNLFATILILLLIAVTHFGVFTISLLFFLLGLIVVHKRKAIIPIVLAVVPGFMVVFIFDQDRAIELFFMWRNAFGLPYALPFYLPGLINLLYSIFIITIIIALLRRSKNEMPDLHKQYLRIYLYFIIILAFPFYNFELGRRLGLMLFIPQTIILLFAYPYLKSGMRKAIPIIALSLTISSLFLHYSNPKQTIITQEAYNDLKNISGVIRNPDKTIIFTRHGMEWWIVWELQTKMAHSYVPIDNEILSKYDDILFLTQKKGVNNLYPVKNRSFTDPDVPENNELIYSSAFYDLYRYIE